MAPRAGCDCRQPQRRGSWDRAAARYVIAGLGLGRGFAARGARKYIWGPRTRLAARRFFAAASRPSRWPGSLPARLVLPLACSGATGTAQPKHPQRSAGARPVPACACSPLGAGTSARGRRRRCPAPCARPPHPLPGRAPLRPGGPARARARTTLALRRARGRSGALRPARGRPCSGTWRARGSPRRRTPSRGSPGPPPPPRGGLRSAVPPLPPPRAPSRVKSRGAAARRARIRVRRGRHRQPGRRRDA